MLPAAFTLVLLKKKAPHPPQVFVSARGQFTLPWKPELLSAVHTNSCGCTEYLLLPTENEIWQAVCVYNGRKSPKHVSISIYSEIFFSATHTYFVEAFKISLCEENDKHN